MEEVEKGKQRERLLEEEADTARRELEEVKKELIVVKVCNHIMANMMKNDYT